MNPNTFAHNTARALAPDLAAIDQSAHFSDIAIQVHDIAQRAAQDARSMVRDAGLDEDAQEEAAQLAADLVLGPRKLTGGGY